MNENEMELLEIIRGNDDPEQAVLIAIDTILKYLAQHESFEGQAVAGL